MNIQKLGHCCLLIKTGTITILTDPGTYSTMQDEVIGIDMILITHEHGDHFHLESLRKVIANNPAARIITNTSVGKLLDAENIAYEVVLDGQKNESHGALIEGYGDKHAIIYENFGQVENTGYMIDGKLFYPGDAFTNPNRPVDILALPVAGPWMKISEAIDYTFALKPRVAFPVHDGILKHSNMMHQVFAKLFETKGIQFAPIGEGEEKDL